MKPVTVAPWAGRCRRAALAAALACAAALAALTASPARAAAGDGDYGAVARRIADRGDALVAAYDPARGADTSAEFSTLYFSVFESSGMEMRMRAASAARLARTEARFAAVVDAAMRGRPPQTLAAHWNELRDDLLLAGAELGRGRASFGTTVAESLVIMLREGLEVLLVLTALIAYLRRIGAAAQLRLIYAGAAAGLGASLATAWIALSLIGAHGGLGVVTEGIAMLVAAAMLFYLSFWLFAKREATRWHQYVQGEMRAAVAEGRSWPLVALAFLAVYREGAETVLFYVALLSTGQAQFAPVLLGIAAGLVLLAGIYWAMRTLSFRLNFGLFFSLTALLFYLLSVSFAGRGVFALQLAGWIPSTGLAWVPAVSWLGLFPTAQVVATQAALLGLGALGLLRMARMRTAGSGAGKTVAPAVER